MTPFFVSPKVISHRYIFFLKIIWYQCSNSRWAACLCFKSFFHCTDNNNLFKKLILAIILLKALLYWQKAADTMLWWKADAVMEDGVLKEDRAVQQWRSGERRAPSHSLPKRQSINMITTEHNVRETRHTVRLQHPAILLLTPSSCPFILGFSSLY